MSPPDPGRVDRQRGAILGLAIGDALGAAVEFQPPGSFEPVSDFRAGGPHGLQPGEWTDDTSMALALADSIASAGWDLHDQANRYLLWWQSGHYSVNGTCFDIGTTTAAALARFQHSRDPRASGDPSPNASGNGSIMRLAPVPAAHAHAHLYPDQLPNLIKRLVESSLTTHASPQCLSACAYFGLVLAGLIAGESRESVLDPQWKHHAWLQTHRPLHPEILAVSRGSYRNNNPPRIRGSGYVVASLEAALWAFHKASTFEEAVLSAVNLGDDADTTGAVCGQLAGAYWGESGIPRPWRDRLAARHILDPIVEKLVR